MPVRIKGTRRVAELASIRFLRERIRLTQKAKGDAKKDTESTAQSITSALLTDGANRLLEQIKTNIQRVFNTTKDRHKQKFEKLTPEKQAIVSAVDTPYVDKANWVVNLSSRSLSDAEKALLKKGLNFAVTPANIPATEIIAKVEAAARQLDTEQADTVRRVVNGILIANLYMESFEEQAITTSSYEPRIWKRHVDDTFTILDRENVDDFLQHLNNQQPFIRFIMETDKDNKLAFLDTAVLREPDGRLTTSVYRKPTHTDQYLAYDSHHPQLVKRSIVKCLYERAKRLVTKPSVISEENKTSVICSGF